MLKRAASLLGVVVVALAAAPECQGALEVEIVNGYNLIVDSNVTAPPTYAPRSAYIGAKICNTGAAAVNNVFAYVGDYNGGTGSTPGVFESRTFASPDPQTHLYGTGSYALQIEAGDTGIEDGTRYIGTVGAGQCRVEYWLFSYPQCVNVGGVEDYPPCAVSITGGIKPFDDPVLFYDVWATGDGVSTVSQRRDFTMRNEISASANKIWPNNGAKVPDEYLEAIASVVGWDTLGPDGQPFEPPTGVYPGEKLITTEGIWYDLGVVVHGFDNNDDLVPDQNAWMQPVGDPASFDAGCFRLLGTYGLLIVKLKTGGELLIPFKDQLYFESLPENTGVVGLVYYQYMATGEGCSSNLTPYQESASGYDNEKFSADYGLSFGVESGEYDTDLVFEKTDGVKSTSVGSTLTYTVTATNNVGVNLGAPDIGAPLAIRETIPAGTSFVAGSADDNPTSNLTEPSGTGSYEQGYTDIEGDLDTCTINFNINPPSSWVILYSDDNGATWSATEPSGVTDIQWLLSTTLALDGGHDGNDCITPDGTYDNGTVYTSLPAGKTAVVRFQVTVAPTVGPVVCNYAHFGFGGAISDTVAEDCDVVSGNNTLSGTVFEDDGAGTGGVFGNGIKDNTSEIGIGGTPNSVIVELYYDLNGDGVLDGGDIELASTTTSTSGTYSFTDLPDGPFLVVVKKYDGPISDGLTNAVHDFNPGWGNTTTDPNLDLDTDQGIVKMSEDPTTVVLAVNIDLNRDNGTAQSVTNVNFGFAPPFQLTKTVAGNPDGDSNGVADTTIGDGAVFDYAISLENRLPAAGIQGPTGCQYTVWASTGATGNNPKDFANPGYAYDATSPNRMAASAYVDGGGLRWIRGANFNLLPQTGTITKVEALYFGYFSTYLTDDFLSFEVSFDYDAKGLTTPKNTGTYTTAMLDSYVGEPANLGPNSAISWDITGLRPGTGSWSWADIPGVDLLVNADKASQADAKYFYLDAIGVRVTSDQSCAAMPATTLSPVPLRDTYDTGSFTFVSAVPPPTSVDTTNGVILWDDVGPLLPGTTNTVTVTMQAKDLDAARNGSCQATYPDPLNQSWNNACNWAHAGYGSEHVTYVDGRPANDDDGKIALNVSAWAELHGIVWQDTNTIGWPKESSPNDPGIPNVGVTLWGCRAVSGAMITTPGTNKTCAAQGGAWEVIATTVTDSSGAYDFTGLRTGYYIVEVGNTDGAPDTGNVSPFGGTQTAEANDDQSVTGTSPNLTASGHTCPTCNNTWGVSTGGLYLSNLRLLSETNGETINGINFGYQVNTPALYGNVWWDINGNAVRNFGEGGLGGFTVELYNDDGDGILESGETLAYTTASDESGNYYFSGLSVASYIIKVVPPTLPNNVWTETVESTGGTGSLNNQIPVTLTSSSEISGSHDFGYTLTDASNIGDTVYFDVDGDGVQDVGETGIPNITVYLYTDVDRDGIVEEGFDTLVGTDSTDANGMYLFEGLPEGSYVVVVDTSDPDFPANVTATGDPDLYTGTIGNVVFFDADGDGIWDSGEEGIPGVVVLLHADSNGNGRLDTGEPLLASAATDVRRDVSATGNYLFTGLNAGKYLVVVDTTTLPSTALARTGSPAYPEIAVTLASGTSSVLTADFGYSPSTGYAIGNRVWHDLDGDGVQDLGEVGIPGVDVTVVNGTGSGCPSPGCTVTTDEHGFWIVPGLGSGTYTVTVDTTDLPRNFTATTTPSPVTVNTADVMTVDFGFRYTGSGASPTGSISGRIFEDQDDDLAYDAGEALVGSTVNLLDADGYVVATTTTLVTDDPGTPVDERGTYSFAGVFIGEYTVQSVNALGTRYSPIFLSAAVPFPNINVIYQQSIETTPDSKSSVAVDGVHDDLNQDFGYRRYLGSIGDTIWWDVNENADQDIGEPGLAGVTVNLYVCQWSDDGDGFFEGGEQSGAGCSTAYRSAVTTVDDPLTSADEGGKYLFSNLPELASGWYYLVGVNTATLPGTSWMLIGDPSTDGIPCPLPNPNYPPDEQPPAGVCDSLDLARAFTSGANYLGADFGYQIYGSGYGVFGDRVWIDTDGDGFFDSGERGVVDVTVWIDADNDGTVDWSDGNGNGRWDAGEGERWTETNSDGYYLFSGLADGTYSNVRVLTSDPQWPAGLPTTPTYEVRLSNTGSLDSVVPAVTISGGVVTSIDDGYVGNDPDDCTGCDLAVDFGYRYPGSNSLSGTICTEAAGILDGYCGATASTYSGTATGESPLAGLSVGLYLWTDDGDSTAWDVDGNVDSGDTFVLLGTAATNSFGDYSFSNVPDNVVVLFGIPPTMNLDLTTTNANTSVEDPYVPGPGVYSYQLFEGTTSYLGNTVTVLARQALNLAGDPDNVIYDLDFALDGTLGGNIAYDFGDLPTLYSNTLLVDSGAQHKVTFVSGTPTSITLGGAVTSETDGQESPTATGDSDNGISGVPTTFPVGGTLSFTATASAGGWLAGWIDWNRDGDFNDADEAFVDRAVTSGSNTISFQVPSWLVIGTNVEFFTRFRIYPARPTFLSSVGLALDATFQPMVGEVEDYRWNVNVTPAVVTSFVAREVDGAVALEWETASEIGTVGFFVDRWDPQARQWVPVNEELLPALLDFPQGGVYRFFDRDARPGTTYHYRLVEAEALGSLNPFGPYRVNTDVPRSTESIGSFESGWEAVAPLEEEVELVEDPDVYGYAKAPHRYRPAALGESETASSAKASASVQAAPKPKLVGAKIAVDTTGITYVSLDDIAAKAGYPIPKTWLTSNQNLYAFTNLGETVAFMAAPDASGVYFYGQAVNSIFAADNVYWIGESTRNSPRMKVRKEKSVSPPQGDETFLRTVHFEQDKSAAAAYFSDPEASYWLWAYLVAGSSGKAFDFRADGISRMGGEVSMTIRLQGASDTAANPDHHAVISVNGRVVEDVMWNGLASQLVTITIDPDLLADGANTLEIEGRRDTGAPYSIFYLDWFDVTYRSSYRARENRLQFSADGNASILVSGFTRPDIMLFDVTDPVAPVYIEASSVGVAGGYGVALAPSAADNVYIALTPDAVVRASRIKPDSPSTLKSKTNRGEYLVITTRELADTAQRLAQLHPDLSSQVIDIEDVWDEFNYGIASPKALRAFLEYAWRNWAQVPRYVVLAGDGSYDYKNVMGVGGNLVPAMMVHTPFGLFVSDTWFANVDPSTKAPEIAIGRLPATTAAELETIIDKIATRSQATGSAWMKGVMLVADNQDAAGNFPVDSNAVAALAPASTPISKVYLSQLTPTAARAAIVNGINAGTGLVGYIGHAGYQELATEGILRNRDLPLLTNAARPTVMTAMTCLLGNYSLPGYPCLSELIVRQQSGGAAAVWSPTGLSQNELAVVLAKEFYKTAFGAGNPRIGDAILAAAKGYEASGGAQYILDIYALLGDPAMRLY